MQSIILLLVKVIELYSYVLFAAVIFSWLYQFNIVNASNRTVRTIGDILYKATEPALRPLRRFVPYIGGMDISPIVLLLLLWLASDMLLRYVLPNVP
ncbi:MAG: YggT family protein [Alphaproteobacteria bacterium]|nr:YggT family protein [Alphaproteobacteria bacterium]